MIDASALGLDGTVTTVEGKLLVSVLALAVAVAAAWTARRSRERLKQRLHPVVTDVATSLIVLAVFGVAVTVIVDVWGQSDVVLTAASEFDGQNTIPKLMVSGIVLVGAQVVTGTIRRLLDDLIGSRDAVTDHQREITYRLSQLLVWLAALIALLGVWGIQLEGLLIGAGFLGIVVGMAARQTLGALLAGFVLMFSRPFEIGDWVEVGDGSQEGVVTDITMMNTRIQTFDGEYVMVPNDVISGQSITNRSRKGRLRLEVEVGVDYDADVERARDFATDAVEDVDGAMDVPTPQTVIKRFGDSSVVLGVRFWIDKPSARRRWRARTAAIAAIKGAFDDAGIAIPFPQRTIGDRGPDDAVTTTDGETTPSEAPSPRGDE
jgi:small-conductance mechanosensitive channel